MTKRPLTRNNQTPVGSKINLPKLKITKDCFGCGDTFTCSQFKNYDYCSACELNGSRYIPRASKCSECGDGSGIIKFPNQPPRNCKLCQLAKLANLESAQQQLPNLEKELEQISQIRQQLESYD